MNEGLGPFLSGLMVGVGLTMILFFLLRSYEFDSVPVYSKQIEIMNSVSDDLLKNNSTVYQQAGIAIKMVLLEEQRKKEAEKHKIQEDIDKLGSSKEK